MLSYRDWQKTFSEAVESADVITQIKKLFEAFRSEIKSAPFPSPTPTPPEKGPLHQRISQVARDAWKGFWGEAAEANDEALREEFVTTFLETVGLEAAVNQLEQQVIGVVTGAMTEYDNYEREMAAFLDQATEQLEDIFKNSEEQRTDYEKRISILEKPRTEPRNLTHKRIVAAMNKHGTYVGAARELRMSDHRLGVIVNNLRRKNKIHQKEDGTWEVMLQPKELKKEAKPKTSRKKK